MMMRMQTVGISQLINFCLYSAKLQQKVPQRMKMMMMRMTTVVVIQSLTQKETVDDATL